MTVAVAVGILLLAFTFGFASRTLVLRGTAHAVLISCVLMLVIVRSLVYEFTGERPTATIVLSGATLAIALALGARSIDRTATSALVIVGALLALAFRNGWSGDIAYSSLTLAIPALIIGVTAPVSIRVLRFCLGIWGGVLAVQLVYFGTYSANRLILPEENPIWIARAAAIACIALLYTSWPVYVRIPLIGLGAVVIEQTGSRGPLWGLLLVAALYCRSRLQKPYRGLATAAAIALGGGIIMGKSMDSVLDLGIDRTSSAMPRYAFWQQAVSAWRRHPLTGSGTGSDEAGSGLAGYPHNFVLEVLAQTGVVGLALVVGLMAVAMIRTRNGLARSLFVAALCFAFVSGSFWTSFELWVMVGVCLRNSPGQPRVEAPVLERRRLLSRA